MKYILAIILLLSCVGCQSTQTTNEFIRRCIALGGKFEQTGILSNGCVIPDSAVWNRKP